MKITPFNSFICNKYEQLSKGLFTTNDSRINALHDKAVKCFSENGLSEEKIDSIQQFAINKIAETAYTIQLTPAPYRPIEEYFRCKIQNIDTHMFAFLNGWYIHKSAPLTIFPNGVIVGSLMEAIKQYPDLVFPYLAKENINSNDIFLALNEALFIDGLFVYIRTICKCLNRCNWFRLLIQRRIYLCNNVI